MWDVFLGTTQSCLGFGTPKTQFAKRKLDTDINSIEYKSYIRRDVLGYLDKYAMPSKKPKVKKQSSSVKKNVPSDQKLIKHGYEEKKNTNKIRPVYLRVDAKGDTSSGSKVPSKNAISGRGASNQREGCECHQPRTLEKKCHSNAYAVPLLYEPITLKCPAKYCDIEKRKKAHLNKINEAKKRSSNGIQIQNTKEKEKPKDKSIEKSKEKLEPPKRYPILVLRKKVCPKKGDSTVSPLKLSIDPLPMLMFGKYKIYLFGEKGSGFKSKAEPQDFYKIRDDCLEKGLLFEDPEFPATDSSLFFSQRPDRYYEWKRPHEICDSPQFFVEGYSRFDVQQGELGDCWLLAAAANLTLYHRLFLQIVPDDQDFDDKYAGIFHFRFWQYGRWIDVTIDDRLPTYRGELVFLHSTDENEFWSALLEKAYAKLHGSYEALKGGSTCEAMEDFTGGVTEMYELEASPPNLFQIMHKAYERASLMGCSIEPDPNVLEAQTPQGLIRGHAYSITRIQYVDIQTPNVTGKIPLLRLRNPWGNESEWNGPWSDGAAEWRFISESEKEDLGLTFDNDGEFWMSFKDFEKHFSRVEICNLNPDSLSEEELREGHKKKWEMSVFEGEWVRGVTAGGCRNFLESFWHNPQYRVTLTEIDEDDEEGNCTLIVALMQKNRRQIRSTGVDLLTVGFAIYHLPHPDSVPKPLDIQFFKYNASVARSPSFINLREVSCRFKLPPGTYCIVPSTFDPNEEGEFLLRVFSENQNNMEYDGFASNSISSRPHEEVDEDEGSDDAPSYRPPAPPARDSTPSAPYGGYPSTPGGYNPYPSSPGYPSDQGYPQPGFQSNPGYPQPGGYPYPQPGGYPQPSYPQSGYSNPQPGYPQPGYSNPQYPGYPGYPSQPQPPPRNRDKGDPIINFFNKLFK